MADISIKMGVNGPGSETNRVLRIFEIVDECPAPEGEPCVFCAYESDFSDGALGILTSMSVILNYTDSDGMEATFTEHILQAFERYMEQDGRPACRIVVSPVGRRLIRFVFGQRDREGNEEERSRYVQTLAEELGLA